MAISTIGTDGLASASVTSAKLASGAPSRSQLPAGTVLQVVNADTTTGTSTSSTTFVVTNLTASITPTSATSKIAIFVSGGLYINTANQDGILTVYRNGANLSGSYGFTETFATSSNIAAPAAVTYVDSPATTSAITYDVRIRASSGTVAFPVNATKAALILMEIAA